MNLTGVDVPIALIRDDLASYLWPDVSNKIFYAKAYRNEKFINGGNQLIPEVYTQDAEYCEVLYDDRYNVSVFFDAGDTRDNVYDQPQAEITIHFAVNLEAVHPGQTYRTEENAIRDVIEVLRNSRNAYSIDENEMSVDNGLIGYGDFFRDNVKGFNMHPCHVFSVSFNVNFTYDCGNPHISTIGAQAFVYPFPIILTN